MGAGGPSGAPFRWIRGRCPLVRGWDRAIGRSLAALNVQVVAYPILVHGQDRGVLAKREALPFVGKQNALQIGMACEANAEHVEDLALEPIRSREEPSDGNGFLVKRNACFH